MTRAKEIYHSINVRLNTAGKSKVRAFLKSKRRMKKILFTAGHIEIYPDKIHLVKIALFSRPKTTAIPLSDIKQVSAPFEVLRIETTRGVKYNLRFWDHLRAFVAQNAIRKAMKDARY